MRILTGVRDLASKIFHSSQINDEIEEELRSHIQHRADDLQRSGLNRAGAERRARIEFGGYVRFTEEGHEAMGGIFWETLLKDVRLAFRVLRKSSGFGIVAMLTLALAIGANAVIFSVMNGLILRPLNVPQAQSLYAIERTADQNSSQSYPDYLDLRGRNRTLLSRFARAQSHLRGSCRFRYRSGSAGYRPESVPRVGRGSEWQLFRRITD
ncbi:MAG TPA: permease prefix domain 1-containing protein [Bryobacteraceae bacterium]|nr:permease prefix domain 1-containing protein [Bryobacteraceae bacterium]